MHVIARIAWTVGRGGIVAATAGRAMIALGIGQADQDELLDDLTVQIYAPRNLANDGEGIVRIGDI